MPVGEVIFGAVLTVLLERLASREVVNFARRAGIESQLKKWRYMMLKIHTVLADAEEKQIRGDSPVNLWLQELRDLVYDVDDLLDEFAYDALAESNRSSAQGEGNALAEFFSAWNPSGVISNSNNEKIKKISQRFEDIVTERDSLQLNHSSFGSGGSAGNLDDRGTSCVVDESAVFGRVKDKEAVIELLLQPRDEVKVGVLPIVGMGGLGKTTLAQLIYNDRTVEESFPVRAWTCVSDQFDVVRITRSILESLKITPTGTDLNSLQVQLKEALSGKKFLIVLDDVWNEDYGAWDSLYAPFSSGLSGSMIVVTTRNEGVASLVGDNFEPYCLMQLSDEICLSIFLRHALRATSFEAHQNLADIGIEIAKRCKGLPLAAKMLGGILRNRYRPEQWTDILQSNIWDLPESRILPALKLSYHHLPSHLKQCFAYCSLFPADCEFEKQDLIMLWMAEGFLQPPSNQNKNKQMEELGSDYFDDLTSRSFFQRSGTGSSTFVMHDLVHELARHVVSDAYLQVDNHDATSQNTSIVVRHSSVVRGEYDTFKRLEAIGEMNKLRTFLALPIQDRPPLSFLSRKVLLDLLKLTQLRVLSLSGYMIKELPDYVGQLKHLRYLNMARARIEKLPESVTLLFNLLTLILRHCENLKELPLSIGNLAKLQYLDLDHTLELSRMPSGIKNLTDLRKLSKFIVGEKEELGISDLKKFSSLQGKLLITGLHNVVDISSATHASLNSKDGLEELGMEWRDGFEDSRDEEIERQVLDHLQPPKSVKKLDIICYGGKELPSWIGNPQCAPNIVRLRIDGCKRVTSLPSLGKLPLLKELILSGLDGITRVGDEFYGYDAFPSLETLSISNMRGWKEWSCSRGLSMLRKLVLDNCPELMGKLPSHLPSLKELEIRVCRQLTGKFPTLSPSIERLQILYCPQLTTTPLATHVASLSYLDLRECVLDEGFLQVHLRSLTRLCIANISDLRNLNMLNSLPCLRELRIYSCSRLVSFGQVSLPSTVKILELSECRALKNLPPMHAECFLESLNIYGCDSLECFPVVEEATSRESVCWRMKCLQIDNSKLLEDIRVHGIESLWIKKCQSLMCFPARGKKLPCSLKSLAIRECENLHTLTEGMLMQDHDMPWSLENIRISCCNSLTCFPTVGKLPSSLKTLVIQSCSELAAIPGTLPGSSLEAIFIFECLKLEELPLSLVKDNILSLKRFFVGNCKSLRSLPSKINSLTGLVELCIRECPAIRWPNIPQGGRVGLPLNLVKLTIGKTLLPEEDMSKWGLNCLTSLQWLSIHGEGMDDVISFPECFFLPTSLTSLQIVGFYNLESLPNGLQELSFLKKLTIQRCPNLRSLPSEGLPSTLEALFISESPNMGGRCKKDGGDYWPSISHIPFVKIDWDDEL